MSPARPALLGVLLALPLGILLGPVAVAGPDRSDEGRAVAARLLAEETISQGAWQKLEWLTDRIGHRLSGSAGAELAVAWALAELQRDRLERVRAEGVRVPRWVRGAESFELIAPVRRPLAAIGLGNSVGTGPGGVSGRVVAVRSFEELYERSAEVAGSVVFFNRRMVANGGKEDGYGAAARLRYQGPAEAAKLGARAMLIRSLATASLRTPHTGSTGYEDFVEPIPGAAVSTEDADLLERLLARGAEVEVCLRMAARMHDDVLSANVVGELLGRESPEQIVLIGAHLDSWDVGQGAVDDGAGVAMVLESLRLLRKLDLRPRRTIRGVLFMNEENGLRGGHAYEAAHRHARDLHVAALESDAGAAWPQGFALAAGAGAGEQLRRLLEPLSGLGCAVVLGEANTGADISPLEGWGVPRIGLHQDMTHYFDWHHSESDTLDKVKPAELTANVVAMAYAAWALAEAEVPLARKIIVNPLARPRDRKTAR